MILSKKNSHKFNFSKTAVLLLAISIMTITACSMKNEESTVSILKDGRIDSQIIENFEKPYYDQDELQQRILQEVASYNRMAGEGAISVEKVDADNGIVRVKMTYAKASDYAAFNNGVFFVGSIEEAREAGYDLNKVLSSTKDSLVTVGMSDMLAMTDVQILITDMKEPVTLNGKAAYISNNVTVNEKLKTVIFDQESKELSYIIYTD